MDTSPVVFVNEADALRTKVIDITLLDTQAGVGANAGRKRYTQQKLSTGAGWYNTHGVGLEILRIIWSLDFYDGSTTATNNLSGNVGAERQYTAGMSPASGLYGWVTHSFRLMRESPATLSTSDVDLQADKTAFSVYRTKHNLFCHDAFDGAGEQLQDTCSTVVEGQIQDLTDGNGHGFVITNPTIVLLGETMVGNSSANRRWGLSANITVKVSAKLICRPVVVDLDTFHKCF